MDEAIRDALPSQGPAADDEPIFKPLGRAAHALIPEELFDEVGYLRLNPDVQQGIEAGRIHSAYAHYRTYGVLEKRKLPETPRESRNVMHVVAGAAVQPAAAGDTRCAIDALLVATGSGLLIAGWIDDAADPLRLVRLTGPGWHIVLDHKRLMRVRRPDVEDALGTRSRYAFGFLGFVHFDRGGESSQPIAVELWQRSGTSCALRCAPTRMDAIELRNMTLAQIASAQFFGSHVIESMRAIGEGFGAEILRHNRAITNEITANPYVQRFGSGNRSPRGSIIVCLYGKAEYFFLQQCLFGGRPGIEDYEFIYVSNSPELAETLLREAQSASLTYGLDTSIVVLPGNAGFGGANNCAARFARSDRLLFVNPDVFPYDADWARKHTTVIDTRPPEETRLFGVPLYYDDGSLMHGGMYFETDTGLSLADGKPLARSMCRVEHYGKGAPPDTAAFTRSRPVPAVTGAFISTERSWFETLGGFTEDFVFGHYEDADLCLKSLAKGTPAWLHDCRLWHLEGKGSTRQLPHEGGSLVNRWLFSERWMQMINDGLRGPHPTHPAFRDADSTGTKTTAADRPGVSNRGSARRRARA